MWVRSPILLIENIAIFSSVAEPKLFIFGSGSTFVINFGSSSRYILLRKTVL